MEIFMRIGLVPAVLLLSTLKADSAYASEPATEQLSLLRMFQCGGAVDESTPPCSIFELLDADGTHPIVLPGDADVAWSPDGRRFASASAEGITVFTATGVPEYRLTAGAAYTPAWSPDGTRIAFASDRNGPLQLQIVNIDGSGLRVVATPAGTTWHPTWSPDSTRLAFTCIPGPAVVPPHQADISLTEICRVNADGSQFTQLTNVPGADVDPEWSPEGGALLFVTTRYDGFPGIARMDPSGGNVTGIGAGFSPAWSSDGRRIAFVTEDPCCSGSWLNLWTLVWVMNADGTGIRLLEQGSTPKWRPWDGMSNQRPVASFTTSCDDTTCTLDAAASVDPDGTVEAFGWRFSDGTTGTGPSVTKVFPAGESGGAVLVVMDDRGALGTAAQVVTVNHPPMVSFTSTCNGLSCAFDATASRDPDGTIASFQWRFGDGDLGSGPSRVSHTYSSPGTYTVTLTVWDNAGASAAWNETVTVNTLPAHVGDIDGSAQAGQRSWVASIVILIHDPQHAPVAAALVVGQWHDGATASCTSGTTGQCVVSRTLPKSVARTTFSVAGVTHERHVYAAAANHDPDGESSGTTIVVSR